MQTKWIPEAPGYPGVYANLLDEAGQGKIHGGELQPSTMNLYMARMFDTAEECDAWCKANPKPPFEPKGHGFLNTEIAFIEEGATRLKAKIKNIVRNIPIKLG